MTIVLSIQTGHNATAALLQDGKIVGVVSEERFTRVKNYSGFPTESVQWLLKFGKTSAKELDAVAICGEKFVSPYVPPKPGKKSSLLVRAYGWLEYKSGPFYWPLFKIKSFLIDRKGNESEKNLLFKWLHGEFKIPKEKVSFVNHHLCHAHSAYFGQSGKREKALVLTLDGEGDDSCATVNVAEGLKIDRKASTWRHYSLGYIYSMTTRFLGMTPLEHEYKVMGLAPYASSKGEKYFLKTYDKVFKDIIWLDKKNPLTFKSKFPTNRFELHLKKTCVGERFDNVAGALQYLTEELVKEWVRTAVKKTGISNVYAGGGVFMNVKMNMALSQLPEVKSLNVLPSCGDESNPIGAAYFAYLKICEEKNQKPNIQPIKDLYLGPGFDDEVESYIKKKKLDKKYDVREADAKMVAELLAKGEVVARCVGRQEWGARSLGNRAIMANPSDLRYVWQINEQIKMRDFWMPFAPSVLKEREADYIENPKKLGAPYMIMAFNSTQKARTELRAAMHQADFTLRPQLVERDWNEKYYDIIKEFEKLTGIGGILNTSFNLHGKPIVSTPKDAVEETFENSGLPHLLLGDYLISKRK
ncbi:MAG: hypothetical protein EDM72_13200 [Chlorobiota bacterium]|nr:MAG: hypothetical protein EDM72_13200 [Chlorobiota bacterium]